MYTNCMKSQLSVPGPRYGALIGLLRTAETLWNASRIFFARWDLSPSQFNVLNLLFDQPEGCTQVELSRQLIMHRSNVTGLVDRLEARGLLRREERASDRRAFNVVLTAAGQKLIRQIQPHYYAAAETVWGDIPAVRAQQLVAEFGSVSRNAEQMTGDSVPA
jgi:DNA-binding MarR family transcriptional regulator